VGPQDVVDFVWTRRLADTDEWVSARPYAGGEVARWLPIELRLPVIPVDGDEAGEATWNTYARDLEECKARSYRPLSEAPALFRRFSELEPSEEAIARFSREFGPLTSGARVEEPEAVGSGQHDLVISLAEPFSLWTDAISSLRGAVELWEALAHVDVARIKTILDISEPDIVEVLCSGPFVTAQWSLPLRTSAAAAELFPGRNPYLYEGFHYNRLVAVEPGIEVSLAKDALRALIDTALVGTCALRLGEDMRLQVVPQDLLAAMWVQLARAIDGGRTYRRCEGCGEWMEIAPDVARSDKKYCSTTCRSRDHRKRQKEKGLAKDDSQTV
jgi:hypothetical protein